mmetsp:Transcript_28552/g.91454  ORF Transcript_28552/g.91454 Transcript_28552/m.91454 type:complete len:193 (+) Transcript_28552:3-581(+)
MVTAMALVLFCVTGCEHSTATWLPLFGQRVGGVAVRETALISSAYWGSICLGRLLWAALSHAVTSGFLVLALDALAMSACAIFFVCFALARPAARGIPPPTWQLWIGSVGLALGFASSLPCAITLPTEAGVRITPGRLLAMNLAGSAGELIMPFAIGAAFQRGWFDAFGATLIALNIAVLCATGVAQNRACG